MNNCSICGKPVCFICDACENIGCEKCSCPDANENISNYPIYDGTCEICNEVLCKKCGGCVNRSCEEFSCPDTSDSKKFNFKLKNCLTM